MAVYIIVLYIFSSKAGPYLVEDSCVSNQIIIMYPISTDKLWSLGVGVGGGGVGSI